MRRIAAALLLLIAAGCGSSAGGPARPETPDTGSPDGTGEGAPATGYFAAGTVGQNPETGAYEFTGNPLAVAWIGGDLRPLGGEEDTARAVAAFREARVVAGIDGRGRTVEVSIAETDPKSQGMFTMRLGGTVAGGADVRTVLLALPGVALEPVALSPATVPDATSAEQTRRLRAALAARPPHDECGDNTYEQVEDVSAAAGAHAGEGSPLLVTYKATVNTRARAGTGEALSALFLGAASSVEPPYLGLCKDNPAWRADPELAAKIAGARTFLLVISACGCEQEDWTLIGTGP